MGSSPVLGSVLTMQSLLEILFLPLSAPPLLMRALSLKLKKKKKKRSRQGRESWDLLHIAAYIVFKV